MFWLKNWEPILHGINAIASLSALEEYNFIKKVSHDVSVSPIAIYLAWTMFVHQIIYGVLGTILMIIYLIAMLTCQFPFASCFFCCSCRRRR